MISAWHFINWDAKHEKTLKIKVVGFLQVLWFPLGSPVSSRFSSFIQVLSGNFPPTGKVDMVVRINS